MNGLDRQIRSSQKYLPIHFLAILFVGFCLLSLPSYSAAQAPSSPTDLQFQRIYEGLASGRITAIHQDHYGYIWVGTYSGLHRYDGIDFQIYSSGDGGNSIMSNFVGYIYEDSHGDLLVGSAGGINKYNRETDDFERIYFEGNHLNNPETSSGVNKILEDDDGAIWVAGGDETLYRLDEEKSRLEPYELLDGVIINSMADGGNHSLWLTTMGEGLIRLNTMSGKVVEQHMHDPGDPYSLATNSINSITKDRHGNIWIGSFGEGLFKMEIKQDNPVFHRYRHEPGNPKSLGNNYIYSLYTDKEKNLWVGNENGGLHLYLEDTDDFYRYYNNPQDQYSLTEDSIWAVFQDRAGRYWVGTGQTGLNVADKYNDKFSNFHLPLLRGEVKSRVIRDVLEGEDGNIWLATDGGGVNYFNRKTGHIEPFVHDPDDPNSIPSNAVIHLNRDDQGNLWVGTFRGGLNILKDQNKGSFVSFQDMIDNHEYPLENVYSVHFDQQYDYIWIAALGEGLYRYDKKSKKLEVFDTMNAGNVDKEIDNQIDSFPSNYATHIFEDSDHNIWIATHEGLVLLRSENKKRPLFKHFVHDSSDSSSLPGNVVRHIAEDSKQNIWVATTEGLSRFEPELESFVTYSMDDGLPSNEIRSLVTDDSGNLWIGTNRGIAHFNSKTNTFKNYDRNDGLQGDEFSRYSVEKLISGEIIFGGMNGFNIFQPDDVVDNPFEPAVYFTDFKILNKSAAIGGGDSPLDKHISVTDTLQLSYDQNIFTFEFIGLNYTQTKFNTYAYMMEGFESDWNYVGTQRNATYTNLNPGVYTFRVKASNHDGVWNEEGASLALIISPPFWQTDWFYALAALLTLCLIGGLYRVKVKNIKERNGALEEEVSERTNHLEETLEKLKNSQNEVVEKAHKAGMADIATGVLHNVGNILNSVNTSSTLIKEKIKDSKIDNFVQANGVLREHIDDLERFITDNPKGKKLMDYYLRLEEPLKKERNEIVSLSNRLSEKIILINEVISAQQNYAGAGLQMENASLSDMIDNALTLQAGSIERHSLNVKKKLNTTDEVPVHRSKMIHVLVNIIKNAKESMEGNHPENKNLTIKTWQSGEMINLSITDNGAGIRKENLDKIFSHAFTTKKNGHGFGLHSCANYMSEMGGKVEVTSDGEGQGATFTLMFPMTNKPITK